MISIAIARKYYADLLARRTAAPQTDTAKPVVIY